ncbi:MAG: hypothetical protein Q7U45_01080, partial [Burkholderiaceae bacterium]|nr:hypothetical protein [Burkholderiaceae bacterium]
MNLFNLFLNFLNQLFSPKTPKPEKPDINLIKPFFIKLTQTEYEAHPDFNYNTNEIFCYNKSDCEDRTMALAHYMKSKG